MKNYFDEMEKEILITDDDLDRFRDDIRKKYPAISKKGQASLLAKEMNRVLDEQMNGVPVKFRAEIRKEIYISFISAISNQLTKFDVFKGVESVYKEDAMYLDLLFDWMQNNTVYDVDYRTFKSFMVVNYEHFIETGELMDLEPILPTDQVTKPPFEPLERKLPKRLLLFVPVFLILVLILNTFINSEEVDPIPSKTIVLPEIHPFAAMELEVFIKDIYWDKYVPYPENMTYKTMNEDKVKSYLAMKNSALLEDEYLKILDDVSNEFNINPYLMLAIIGQEQNFIKSDHMYKDGILKNPFNVYNSWESYGISFRDSAEIAARTIRNRLDIRPLGTDPIYWINETYAEDPNWHLGVRYFFDFFENNMNN